MGTAFGLLVLLVVVIVILRLLVRRYSGEFAGDGPSQPAGDAHDKALAAVIAVTALRAGQHRAAAAKNG